MEKLKIESYWADYQDVVTFLNSQAIDFYSKKTEFVDANQGIFLKSSLLSSVIDLERSIRGTFNCDLLLKNAQLPLLKEMFPNACTMFSIKNKEDIVVMGRFLENIRNIHAHAYLSQDDYSLFTKDFSFLTSQQKMNNDIKYYDNGLTVAGIIFLILNFLREESISNLSKRSFLVSIISRGEYKYDDGINFVKEISGVNLECAIRKTNGDNIFSSVFSDYIQDIVFDNSGFSYRVGAPNYPTFKVSGTIQGKQIKIRKGSLTKVYYEDDYILKILDEESFVKLASLLPTMVFIDYLYLNGIHIFDHTIAEIINQKKDSLLKLNKPKFYIDKNMKILLLPSTISDFRLLSSIVSDCVNVVLLLLEDYIFKTRHLNDSLYSTINVALDNLGVPKNIVYEISFLRNLAAHGYILEETMANTNDERMFSLKYIISTLSSLLEYFFHKHVDVYKKFHYILSLYLVDKVMSGKYKKIIESSTKALKYFPNFDKKEMSIKEGFVNNSYFSLSDFDVFFLYSPSRRAIIKLIIDGCDSNFYIQKMTRIMEDLDVFCQTHGFKKKIINCDGLLQTYRLVSDNEDKL